MTKLSYIFFIIILGLSAPAFANHATSHNHDDMAKTDMQKTTFGIEGSDHTIVAQINGLVCDFCARALEKVFGKRDEVTGIEVNLDTKMVTIGFKKGADIDDATITKLITDSGYNVVEIRR